MNMNRSKIYGIGVLLLLVGGAGLAEISTSSQGSFWLCNIVFSLGVAMVITSYKNFNNKDRKGNEDERDGDGDGNDYDNNFYG